MSLLRWKELAKSKSELGNKINYVHNSIKQHKIGEQTSQESFAKVFKPVTSKLDDVIDSDLNLRMPQRRKRPLKERWKFQITALISMMKLKTWVLMICLVIMYHHSKKNK